MRGVVRPDPIRVEEVDRLTEAVAFWTQHIDTHRFQATLAFQQRVHAGHFEGDMVDDLRHQIQPRTRVDIDMISHCAERCNVP